MGKDVPFGGGGGMRKMFHLVGRGMRQMFHLVGRGMTKMFHLVGGGMRKMFHLVGERDEEDVPLVTSPLSLTRIFRLLKVLTEILRALGF